jgi:hypothetical protein
MATINLMAVPPMAKGYGGAERQVQRVNRLHHEHYPGRVHLMCNMPPLNRTVWLGPDGWKLADVAGGWTATARPRAIGMTTWDGVPPLEGDLHIVWNDGNGVEQYIKELMDVTRGTSRAAPGIVWLDGLANLPADRWVIGSLSFGDILMRNREMVRTRQDMTVHLIEYMPPFYETLRAAALNKARPKTVIYKVKRNDTPAKIARARRCKWTDLRTLNKKGVIKTANQKLKMGIQIMVPVLPPAPKKTVKKK